MEKKCYVAPEVEIFEVAVEKGFAASPEYDSLGEEKPLWQCSL